MAVSDFGAPIPGNSLFTHAPGERPWERPVDIDKVEDAISYYMTSQPSFSSSLCSVL